MARTAKRYINTENKLTSTNLPNFHVGIYSRLSVDNDERKSESIENQIDIVKQFIDKSNSNPNREMNFIIKNIYIDKGISGTTFEREGFERLMQDVKKHDINCIIVKDLSRFGRDYLETGNLIEKVLPFLECRFIAVSDNYDSMSPNVNESKLAMNIKNLVNDMYAKDISKKITIARRMSAENGSFVGNFAPYGYEVVNIGGMRSFKIHEECAEVVRKIYVLYSEGASYTEIITYLYENKIHRMKDSQKYGHAYWEEGEELHQWSQASVARLLTNTSYLGQLQQCKTKSGLSKERTEAVCINNTHQAIVSTELFEKVQGRKENHKKVSKDKYINKDTENVYRNVLYCGHCGKPMHAVFYQSRRTKERRYSYYCRSAYFMDARKCEKNYISEEQMTALVLEQVRIVLKEQKVKAKDLTKINRETVDDKMKEYMQEEKKIREDCAYMKKQAAILYGQYKEGIVSKEEYECFKASKKEQEQYAEKRVEEIQKKIKKISSKSEKENKFLRSLLKVNRCKKLNIQLVESLIEKISIFPDGVIDIVYRFSDVEV